MKEILVSFTVAKLAKERGFTMFKKSFKSAIMDSRNYDVQRYSFYRVIRNEQTLELNVGTNSSNINGLWESYNDDNFVTQKNYFAPTQSLLQKWLREVHSISINIDDYITDSKVRFDYRVKELGSQDFEDNGPYKTYEKALEVGLYQALKLIK